MRRRNTLLPGLVLLGALSAQGAVPATLPGTSVQFTPAAPTSADPLTLALSGTWPNACVPETFQVQVLSGDSIWIDLLLPGWDAKDDCKPPLCSQVLTPWQLSGPIQAIAPGSYDVFVRAVDCE
jgi:ABC-type transport system substrate-binding protein